MSKTRKNLLRSSLVMLLVATVALSTATYAWFSAGTTGQITDLKFTATASEGIQISADAVAFKSTLPTSEIQTAQEGALVGKLGPVSSVAKVDTTTNKGTISLFTGTIEAAGTIESKAASVATASADGYYKFDLYVKNEGATAKTLYLDLSSTVKADAKAKTETTAAQIDSGIQNAVRVAFIDQGIGTLTSGVQTVAGVKAANAGDESVVWEPNAKTHTAYATAYRYAVGTDGAPTDSLAAADTLYPYVGISAIATGITASKGAATVVDGKSSVVKTDADAGVTLATDATGTQAIASLPANQIVKVTIYIWLEGQDIDCNNAESGGSVVTNLKFTTTEATT